MAPDPGVRARIPNQRTTNHRLVGENDKRFADIRRFHSVGWNERQRVGGSISFSLSFNYRPSHDHCFQAYFSKEKQ